MMSGFKKIASLIGTYILLLLSAFGVHLYFIRSDAYFTEAWADSFMQIAHYYPYLQREFTEGNFFWSWSNGLGGDLLAGFSYYYTTSPFFWLLMLFPSIGNLTDIFEMRLFISIAKLFIAMVLMYHLLRYLKLLKTSSILGSLIYGGSIFFIYNSFRYDFMIDGMVYLPLLILALEYTMDKKKPWFLIVVVFLTVCSNFYLAFMNSIFLGMYAILKYAIMNEKFTVKSFTSYMLKFMGMYAAGLLLACFAFLPAVYAFLNVDRFYYEVSIPLLFGWGFYKLLPFELFFSANLQFKFAVAFPIIVFLLFPLGLFFKEKADRKRFAFSIFISFLVLIPFTYSFFNGLSAVQYRWLYLYIFAVAMISSFVLDHLIKGKLHSRLASGGLVGLLLILVIGLYFKYDLIGIDVTENDLFILAMALVSGVFLILLIMVRKEILKKWIVFTLLAIMLFNTIFINNLLFEVFQDVESLKERQEKVLQTYATSSQQEMIDRIQEEDRGFYRIMWDQLNEFNTPMLLDYKGFGAYSSLVAGNMHRFMKVDYNTLHQNAPSMFLNLDNRLYLETALANKYYIKPKDSVYTPFGYKFKFEKDSYEIYKNKYALPIGFLYDRVFDKEDLEKLTYAQRDQLLLKAAVVDNSEETGLPIFEDEQLTVEKKVISLADIQLIKASLIDDQLLHIEEQGGISFDNPWKNQLGEVMVELKMRETSKQGFKISNSYKLFQDVGEGTFYNYPRERIAINLVNQTNQDQIKLWFGPGTYEISEIVLTFNSYEQYAQDSESKMQSGLENVTYTSRSVKGQINAEEKSILFLSIPYSDGWRVKVDGKTVEPMEVNSSFTGIPISEGTHEIELTYTTPYFVLGTVISVGTLLVLIGYYFIKRRKV